MKVEKKLKYIIKHYKKWRKKNPDSWVNHCLSQNSLEECIKFAALSIDNLGEKHNHQKGIKWFTLQRLAVTLIKKQQEIENSNTFSRLLQIIESCKVKGIG